MSLAGFPNQLSGLFSFFNYSAVQVIGSWHEDAKAVRSSPVVLSSLNPVSGDVSEEL